MDVALSPYDLNIRDALLWWRHRCTFMRGTAALRGYESLQVVSRDGRTHRSLESFSSDAGAVVAAFDPPGEHLFGAKSGELRVWSIPDFQLIEEQTLPEGISRLLRATPRGLFAITQQGEEMVVTMHALGGEQHPIGRIEAGRGRIDIDGSESNGGIAQR